MSNTKRKDRTVGEREEVVKLSETVTTNQEAVSKETITVQGVSYEVVERIRTRGKDVPEGEYPVVLVNGVRKPVVNGELRALSPFGNPPTIRAKMARPSQKGTEEGALPENAVVLSSRAIALLKGISAVTGATPAEIVDEALPLVAQANDISEGLLQRILRRAEGV